MKFEEHEKKDFSAILNTPQGARFIAGLLDFCGVYRSSHRIGEQSPLDTAFREGQRDVGLMLLRRAQEEPDGERRIQAAQEQRRKIFKGGDADE